MPQDGSVPPPLSRALKREDAQLGVKALGQSRGVPDLYHHLLRASIPYLGLAFAVVFILFNLVFAALYTWDGLGFRGPMAPHGLSFKEAFFFSVATVSTIGYGDIYPVSDLANILVVIEIMLGILLFALTTGIAFARFSRPTARILFSKVAIVHPVDGVPTLMLRAANQRHNLIFEATVRASLLCGEGVEGTQLRRFRDLTLERAENPVFALTWLVMHRIDENSPLRDWLEAERAEPDAELIVVIAGVDDASGQTIHGRWAYTGKDVRWNAKFVDILGHNWRGHRTIDYARFDAIEPFSAESDASR